MKSKIELHRPLTYIVVYGAALVATFMLNLTSIQYEPLYLWVKVTCPLLIFFGIYGSKFDTRLPRILGWLGIALFVASGLQMILPGEDYISGGPHGPPLAAPRLASPTEIGVRSVVFIAVTTALSYSFWLLRKSKPVK
jgi:hypothetical protein